MQERNEQLSYKHNFVLFCNFHTDARVQIFLEDENFLKYGTLSFVVPNCSGCRFRAMAVPRI